ncbi:cell wall synthesis protein CwsA [Mycolicibacterium madagascariense]|uniref:Cell wall synthesis protein CwsA n=1 Tax=Mycolicibacterium madagascariense TaxID=212765 RepID=A0A7I7XPG2_9MYCO|nr:cell wall synthesis protein CwsA [Mycolicibacterium madagascariense]MCV7014104.1 cell wall synthesis protein CwsA [Mycolicibacterium madagascariense]BBZ31129.1 cell wall synthesis protein CwsA [Mycolicibacterium madagascariense]
MSTTTKVARLTPAARIARGLKYTTVGPVDVTRGALGIGVNSTRASASWAVNRYRLNRLKAQVKQELAAAQSTIAHELSAAQDVVANLPQSIHVGKAKRRRPRPLVLAGAAVAVLSVGAVSFSIIRRSTQPEPSSLPPSVDVTPAP